MARGQAVPDGFEEIRELGRGALGVVVLSRHVALDRLCAVKRLLVPPSAGSEAVARFRREASALARLDDPAVVRLYNVVAEADRLYLVMEWVDGRDMRGVLDEGVTGTRALVPVLVAVAQALSHAAEARDRSSRREARERSDGRRRTNQAGGLRRRTHPGRHRDVPFQGGNDGRVSLVHGARAAGRVRVDRSSCGRIRTCGHGVRGDRRPHAVRRVDRDAIIDLHLHGAPVDPSEVLPGYPADVAAVLTSGMSRDPSCRPTVSEISAALRTVDPESWPQPRRDPMVADDESVDVTRSPVGHGRPAHPPHAPSATETDGESTDAPSGTIAATEPDEWIESPVFRPAKRSSASSGRRLVLGGIAAAALVAVVTIVFFVVALEANPVHVGAVDVTVLGPLEGGCPGATFRYVGNISTVGRGPVRVRWTGPDGVDERPLTLEAPGGQRDPASRAPVQGVGATVADRTRHPSPARSQSFLGRRPQGGLLVPVKGDRLQIRLLGPLEVVRDGQAVNVGGRKPRVVLALLALQAGRVVAVDALIEALWGEDPPARALGTLQVHVSALRRKLDTPGVATVLVNRPPGYLLDVSPDMIDVAEFHALVDRGRRLAEAGRPSEASSVLRAADEVWRGPAIADLASELALIGAAAGLEEQRLAATEVRLASDLERGAHADVTGELASLCDEHPLREGLWALLIVALYRSGRQADALATYRSARTVLVEELGIEPGPALQQLEAAVLGQSPDLDLAPIAAASDGAGRDDGGWRTVVSAARTPGGFRQWGGPADRPLRHRAAPRLHCGARRPAGLASTCVGQGRRRCPPAHRSRLDERDLGER